VQTSLWDSGGALSHLRLGQEADLIIVAPATANVIARVAMGMADDFLTSLLLARTAPLILAPAMNDEMFANPATQANLEQLRARGIEIVGPEIGALAEGPSERPGRMSEPETIMAHAGRLLRGGTLQGRRVVVTAGPTREAIDPVRIVTNRSSGKMGYRLAEAAWERGADVVLITGPVTLPAPVGVTVHRIDSTKELEAAVRKELPGADVLVMAAAPADYRPSSPSDDKRSRVDGALAIPMEPTDDILHATRGARKPGSFMVGFALETGDALAKGLAKLERKDLDLIVVNDALEPGAGFEKDTNRVALLGRDGTRQILPLQTKREVAEAILDAVEKNLGR
jgi:phosphopantothenoylcysteine decarboxylase / phosphopantothenate---cysteine ligase